MRTVREPIADAVGAPVRDQHVHEFAGGSVWMPIVLDQLFPDLNRSAAFQAASDAAAEKLESAAAVSIQTPTEAPSGSPLDFIVRVENLTGHKLPTGYPEGRRMWLEIEVKDEADNVLLHSGRYDDPTGILIEDEQQRRYEVVLASGGVVSFHFALQDEIVSDGRIPPRGFRPKPDTQPVGRDYPEVQTGILAHWDEAPYSVEIPSDATGTVTITATLWYQSISRDYVYALNSYSQAPAVQRMVAIWNDYGKAPPHQMQQVDSTFVLYKPGGIFGCRAQPAPPMLWLCAILLASYGRDRRRRKSR